MRKLNYIVLLLSIFSMLQLSAQNAELFRVKSTFKEAGNALKQGSKSTLAGPLLYSQLEDANTSLYITSMERTDDASVSAISADDFTVPVGESWTIGTVKVNGIGDNYDGIEALNVTFYKDVDGAPGDVVKSFVEKSNYLVETWSANSFVFCEAAVNLSEALTLSEGTYWISVVVVGGAEMGNWGLLMQNAEETVGSHYHWKNPENGLGSGFVNWTDGKLVAQEFMFTFLPNLSFSLHAPRVENDLYVTELTSPVSAASLTARETISVNIENPGENAQSGFEMRYRVNGGEWVTETVSEELAAGATMNYRFRATLDMSNVKAYSIEVEAVLANDGDLTNNTLNAVVYNFGKVFNAQDNGTLEVCGASFADAGGVDGLAEASITNYTVKPDVKGKITQVTFAEFNIGHDELYVYNGSSENAELLGVFKAGELKGKSLRGNNPDGALTFSFVYAGWEASDGWVGVVECLEPVADDFAMVSLNTSEHILFEKSALTLKAIVRNNGTLAQSKEVTFKVNGTEVGKLTSKELAQGATQLLELPYIPDFAGEALMEASVVNDGGDLENNSISFVKEVYPQGKLVESFEGERFPPMFWTQKVFGAFQRAGAELNIHVTDGRKSATIPRNSRQNDTLITPMLDIKSGDKLTFDAISELQVFGGLEIIYSVSKNGPWKKLYSCEEGLFNNEISYEIDLSSAVGKHYIGFAGKDYIAIDNIKGPQMYFESNDAAIFDFSGETKPAQNEEFIYTVSVINKGTNLLQGTDYTLDLCFDVDGTEEVLYSAQGVDLNLLEEASFNLPGSFTMMGEGKLYARVNCAADAVADNNTTSSIGISVMKEGTENVLVGNGSEREYLYPFTPGTTSKAGEVLYLGSEINTTGELYGISLKYDSRHAIKDTLEVYIVETDEEELGFIITSTVNYYKVYDADIDIKVGDNHTLYLPFDTPFLYSGKNIRIIYHWPYREEETWVELEWHSTKTKEARTNSVSSNFAKDPLHLDDQNWLDNQYANHENIIPNTIFHIITKQMDAKVSGTVTHADKTPFEGATISVDGFVNPTTTDAEGKYSLPAMPYGDVEIMATAFGYYDNAKVVTLGQVSETVVVDFTMELLPNVAITGRVVSDDYNTPLAGAAVKVTGYKDYETQTAEDGTFKIEDVYILQDYTLSVEHLKIDSYSQDIRVEADTLKLGDVVVNEKETPAYNVMAEVVDKKANITWAKPFTAKDFSLKPGDMEGQTSDNYLVNEPGEDVQIGNLFRLDKEATLKSFVIRVVGNKQLEENGEVTIKIYNKERVLLAETEPFVMPNDPMFLEVPVPNVSFNDDFYGMIHWNKLPNSTPYIGFDYTEDNVAYVVQNNTGEFEKLSDILPGYEGAVRFSANLIEEGTQKRLSLETYSIHRTKLGGEVLDLEWTLLAENLTEQTFVDEDYSTLDSGYYMYRLHTHYTNAQAEVVYSTTITSGIYAALEFTVNTNNGNSADGATITMMNKEGNDVYNYSTKVNSEGKAYLPAVYRMEYDLRISKNGFITYKSELNVLGDKGFTIELEEAILTPANLQVNTEDPNNVVLNWGIGNEETLQIDNGSADFGVTFDTGDAYVGNYFETNTMGYVASIDLFGFAHNDIPSDQTAKVSLEIFDKNLNSLMVSEDFQIPDGEWLTLNLNNLPFEGSFFAMVHMNNGASNYLAYNNQGTGGYYYDEQSGLLTLAEAAGADGVFLIRANVLVTGSTVKKKSSVITGTGSELSNWNKATYYGETKAPVRADVTYNVYLNNMETPVATGISEREYVFTQDLLDGTNVAGVESVYATGTSAMAKVSFTLTDLSDSNGAAINVYPNPAQQFIQVDGVEQGVVEIYNMSGVLMSTTEVNQKGNTIDVSSLKTGTYLIKIKGSQQFTTKLLQIQK